MLFVSHRNQQRPSCCSSTIPRWDGAAPSTWALVGSGAAEWGFTTAEMGGAILGQQQGKGGPFLLAFLFCTSPNFFFFFCPFCRAHPRTCLHVLNIFNKAPLQNASAWSSPETPSVPSCCRKWNKMQNLSGFVQRGPWQVQSCSQSGCCRDCRSAEEQQQPHVHVCRHSASFCPL